MRERWEVVGMEEALSSETGKGLVMKEKAEQGPPVGTRGE